VIDVATGQEVARIDNPPEEAVGITKEDSGVSRLAFSPDGRTLAWSGSQGAIIRVADVATGRERVRFRGRYFGKEVLAFSRDGRFLLSDDGGTNILVWDVSAAR